MLGLSVTAAPNLNDFYNTLSTPGVTFNATDQLDYTVDELLDAFDFSGDCIPNERTEYSDAVYAGKYDVWTNCGGTDTLLVVLVAEPADQSYLALITVQVVTDADLDALDTIFNTFILSE